MEERWTTFDTITFLAAWLGNLSVTAAMLARYAGRQDLVRLAVPAMFIIASSHVLLVWGVRYEFAPGNAGSGGIVATGMLYTIFSLIIVHTFGHARSIVAGRLNYPTWLLVTMAGVPGRFVQPFLSWLQIPMVLTLVGSISGLAFIRWRRAAQLVGAGR